jgi:hypothetical protein
MIKSGKKIKSKRRNLQEYNTPQKSDQHINKLCYSSFGFHPIANFQKKWMEREVNQLSHSKMEDPKMKMKNVLEKLILEEKMMKRLIVLLAVLAMTGFARADLLTVAGIDGTFESYTATPDNVPPPGSGLSFEVNTDWHWVKIISSAPYAYQGTKSLQTGLWAGDYASCTIADRTLIKVSEGDTIKLSSYSGHPWTAGAQAGSLALRWYDSAQALISTDANSNIFDTGTAYVLHDVTAIAPAGTAYVTPVLAVAPGTMYNIDFDNVALEMVSPGNRVATNPVPADGASDVNADKNLTLSWSAPSSPPGTISSYSVYLVTAVDEVQTLAISGATSGTFNLSFRGEKTGAQDTTIKRIAYNAPATGPGSVEEALKHLCGTGIITDVACAGGPLNTHPVTITFKGNVKYQDVEMITVGDSNLTPSDAYSIVETTKGVGDPSILLGNTSSRSIIVPASQLEWNTLYHWRVKTNTSGGSTYGPVWSFSGMKLPVITTQPQDLWVVPGDNAVFTVEATSSLAMTYRWYNSGGAIAGADSNVLTVTDVNQSDVNKRPYYCIVSNAAGDTTSDSALLYLWVKGLLAHYPLDDDFATTSTVLDIADDHNGIAYDNVSTVAGVKDGNAASFDGVGDYIDIGTWNPSSEAGPGQFSISVWVNWAGVLNDVDIWQGIIAKRQTSQWIATQMMWQLEATNGNVVFSREGSDPGMSYQLSEGVWTHIAVTFDGTTATMYANGTAVGSGPFTEGFKPDALFSIGASVPAPAGNEWHGYIDDVRIYNYALEPWEVAVLYVDMTGKSACLGYPAYDFDKDCVVGIKDLAILVGEWLQCNIVPECLP